MKAPEQTWIPGTEPQPDVEKAERKAAKAEAEANRVESRRVPRATVAAEVDPFADLRDRMKADPAETEH